MAKRKRLTPVHPATPDMRTGEIQAETVPRTRAPISQVAGDAATAAALETMAEEMRRVRDSGRLIQAIPEAQIDAGYLVRDRVVLDSTEMQALKESLRDRGQQTAIEVVQLGPEQYGLISGWRRLTAMRQLMAETGDVGRFGHLLAVLRAPEGAADAYQSMVEENEIRVGLNYYERARIAAKAVEQGVFATEKAALLTLFASASRAKRSKIRSFLSIYHALDGSLRFAGAIPERLGLRLSRALEVDSGLAERLKDMLTNVPAENAVDEAARLEAALKEEAGRAVVRSDASQGSGEIDVTLSGRGLARVITLSGPGVNTALMRRLRAWLEAADTNV